MAHPFFDVIVYPHHREEAKEFLRVLILAEQDTDKIRQIYVQSGDNPPGLTLPRSANLVWVEVLDNLTKTRHLRSLCNQVKVAYPIPEIVNAIKALENAIAAEEIKIVSDGIFILDLDDERPLISQVTSDSSVAKIVLVKGETKSGKSHCHFVFESIGTDKDAVIVHLYEGFGDVREVIDYIFSSLGVSPREVPPRDLTRPDAWFRSVCTELKRIVTEKNKKLWIAADDLGYITTTDANGNVTTGPMIDKEIRGFFEQLGFYMYDPSFSKYIRLMLINYAEPVAPTKWKAGTWLEITTSEKSIQQKHVEAFLKDWSGVKNVPMIDQDIKDMATSVMTLAENPSPEIAALPRLQRIHDTLKVKLDEVLRKRPNDNK